MEVPKLLKNLLFKIYSDYLISGKDFTLQQIKFRRKDGLKKRRVGGAAKAIISVYEINNDLFNDESLRIKIFSKADVDWLDFIIANRKGEIFHNYEIIKGPVANDTLYATISLFESGILSKEETIIRLKVHKYLTRYLSIMKKH